MGEPSRKKNTRGMTLIEVMLAAGVLAFSFSVVYGSLITMYVLGQTNEERVRAVEIVSGIVEQVQAMDMTSISKWSAPTVSGLKSAKVSADVMVPSGSKVNATALPLASGVSLGSLPNPCEVRVTLDWKDEQGRAYQYRVSTMKSR